LGVSIICFAIITLLEKSEMPVQSLLNGIPQSYWVGDFITIILLGKTLTPSR
jgi:hypothetical protein